MKAVVLALSIFFVGCGECLPSSVQHVSSVTLDGPPVQSLAIAHSADELRASLGARWTKERLDAYVAETTFGTTDVALVRAGDDRARLAGETVEGNRVTLYFTGGCPACAGGNPTSYEEAKSAYDTAHAARTELVRVPKGAHVEVHVCQSSCGQCPTNVP